MAQEGAGPGEPGVLLAVPPRGDKQSSCARARGFSELPLWPKTLKAPSPLTFSSLSLKKRTFELLWLCLELRRARSWEGAGSARSFPSQSIPGFRGRPLGGSRCRCQQSPPSPVLLGSVPSPPGSSLAPDSSGAAWNNNPALRAALGTGGLGRARAPGVLVCIYLYLCPPRCRALRPPPEGPWGSAWLWVAARALASAPRQQQGFNRL